MVTNTRYEFRIITQATDANCMILNPVGIVRETIEQIRIECGLKNEYFIGGRISGLTNTSIKVSNNTTSFEVLVNPGAFYYALDEKLSANNDYEIELKFPIGATERCSFQNGSSKSLVAISNANFEYMDINCYPYFGADPLTIEINQSSSQLDPTSQLPIEFDVVFNREINPSSFTVSDISQIGTATGVIWGLSTADNITYKLSITASDPGTIVPVINGNLIEDGAGNWNRPSTNHDNFVLFDNAPLMVTINQASSQADPVNALPVEFDIVFNKPIDPATFMISDITQNGSASGITWDLRTNDNVNYSLKAVGVSSDSGTIIPTIAAGTVRDLAGNLNSASTSVDNLVSYSTTIPTVSIASPAANSYVNSANQAAYTVSGTCSENGKPVIISGAFSATVSCNTNVWTTTQNLTSIAQGPLTIYASHSDTAGNTATQASRTFIKDTIAATIAVNQAAGQADPTNTLPVIFTVVFSEPINSSTFTAADITNSGTAAGITWNLATSDNVTFRLTATAITSPGTVIPSIPANAVQDLAGNNSTASTSTDNSVTYDNTPLNVSINQSSGQPDPAYSLPVTFDILFSKQIDPNTFNEADISNSGTATGVTWSLTTSDNLTYSLRATAVTGPGTIIPSILSSKVLDIAGNNNTPSVSTDNSVFYERPSSQLVLSGPPSVPAGSCSSPLTIYRKDVAGYHVTSEATLSVNFTGLGGGTLHKQANCSDPAVTSISIVTGTAFTQFYYRNVTVGNYGILAQASGLTNSTHKISVGPGSPATIVKMSGDGQSGMVGQTLMSPIVARVQDSFSNPIPGLSISFTIISGGGSVSNISAVSDADGRVFTNWTLGTVSGSSQALQAGISGINATFTATANPGPTARLSKNGPSSVALNACVSGIMLSRIDQYNNLTMNAYPVSVNFTGPGGGGFYLDGSCSNSPVYSTQIPAGSNTIPLYFKATTAGTFLMKANGTENGVTLIEGQININVGP